MWRAAAAAAAAADSSVLAVRVLPWPRRSVAKFSSFSRTTTCCRKDIYVYIYIYIRLSDDGGGARAVPGAPEHAPQHRQRSAHPGRGMLYNDIHITIV